VLVGWGVDALPGLVVGCPAAAVEDVEDGAAEPLAGPPLDAALLSVVEDPLDADVAAPVLVPLSVAEFAGFPESPTTVLMDRPVEAAVGALPPPEGVTTTTTPTAITVTAVAATASAVFGVILSGGLVTRTSIGARRAVTQIRVLSVLRCATNTGAFRDAGKRSPAHRLRTGCSRCDEAESRPAVCAASSSGSCVAVS
jgi:hypothetical protein